MFDTLKFLNAEFGTRRNVQQLLADYCADAPAYHTVEKWFQRRAIPGAWFPVLLCIREIETGGPVKMQTYWRNA